MADEGGLKHDILSYVTAGQSVFTCKLKNTQALCYRKVRQNIHSEQNTHKKDEYVNIDQENEETMKGTIKMQGVKKYLERKIINSTGWQIR